MRALSYDLSGNRVSETEDGVLDSYSYHANTNQLNTTGSDTIMHDAAGNRTGDQNGQLISETDSSGGDIRDIVYRGSIPVAQIDSGIADKVTYLHTDHLGTPRMGTDATGEVVWKWSAEAFGDSAADGDPDEDGVDTVVNLRFPGQVYDVETGLEYNYFRYYDPTTGRYITSDPIGLAGSINTYAYVGGNPIAYLDFYGLFCYTPREIAVLAGASGGFVSGLVGGFVAGASGSLGLAAIPGAIGGAMLGTAVGGLTGLAAENVSNQGGATAVGAGSAMIASGQINASSGFGGAADIAVTSAALASGASPTIANGIGGAAGGASTALAAGATTAGIAGS
ncbi:MAG: hypothetical protein GY934_18945, partial [Gammaproteobacteria bacterium]|nr:hypothetical protein [Gammaproteobacteria bacterium]